MSFAAIPPAVLSSAPTQNDDASKGFYNGMLVVDTTVTPPVLYACSSATVGQARWAPVGLLVRANGVPVSGGAATTLNFAASSVSRSNGVATVTPFGGWRHQASFTATNGQTFFALAGLPSAPESHQVFANGMLLRLGASYDYSVDASGITLNFPLAAGNPLLVYY